HFLCGDDFLAGTVAATFCADLVFDVAGGRAKLDQAFYGAPDIEGGRSETRVDVDQQGYVAHIGDAPYVGQHIIQRVDAQVGQAQRAGSDSATGKVDGPIAGALGQQSVIGVDGANDLQWLFFF